VDIEDEKKQHNAFEKALGFHTLMPLDDNTMVVHIGSNLMNSKHKKSGMQLGQDQTPLNDLQSQNLAKEFYVNDLLTSAISTSIIYFSIILFS
jgi:hypothetical protein